MHRHGKSETRGNALGDPALTVLRPASGDVGNNSPQRHRSRVSGLTELEIRREMDYLEERNLIGLERKQAWFAKINNHGIDFVEYTIDAYPGIARPKKW